LRCHPVIIPEAQWSSCNAGFCFDASLAVRTPLNLIVEPTALLINSPELIGFGRRCT
jgi:hypothetical protein